MKESDMLTLLDDIPDAWIASAATPQKHAVPFLRYGTPAIAACITAVTALAVYLRFRPPTPPDITPAATSDTTAVTTHSAAPTITTTQRSTTTVSTAPAVTTIAVTPNATTTEMLPSTITEAVPQTVETTEMTAAPITTALSVTTHSAVTTIAVTSTPTTTEANIQATSESISENSLPLTVSVQKSEPSTPETATQASALQPFCSFRLLTDAEAQEYMDFAHYQYLQIFVSGSAENVDLLYGTYDNVYLSLDAVYAPSNTYTETTFILQLPNDMAISKDVCFLHFTQADTPQAYASMLPEAFVIYIMNTEE